MRSNLLASVLSLAAAALAIGPIACAAPTDAPAAQDPATNDGSAEEVKAAIIGEAQAGKTVDVVLGRSFTIALESNASTGYSWHVASVDKTLGQPRVTTVPGDPNKPGSPGTQKFTWSTKSPLDLVGKHVIQLEYQRPWAETSPPVKTFKVTVNIVDSTQAKTCGGLIGAKCAGNQYCEYGATQCGAGDQTGTCQLLPDVCPQFILPICGCDGKTYGNSCFANVVGVSVAHGGNCTK